MTAFEGLTILTRSLQAGQIRIGDPVERPSTWSRQRARSGSPEGVEFGTRGDVIWDTLTPAVWQKTGSPTIATNVGWVQLAPTTTIDRYHVPILKPGSAVNSGSTTPIASNALLLTAFTLNTDGAWQQFKIPDNFVDEPAFHVHWSKSTNAVNSGRNVRWRMSYTIFDGSSEDGAVAPTVTEVEDTYEDGGTTSRIVYRTADVPLSGFVAGYYMAVEIQAVTPTGTALTGEPGLFALDLTFNQFINQA